MAKYIGTANFVLQNSWIPVSILNPALADMVKSDGFAVDLYDPFFFPDKKIFLNQYNFITCTETAEHFQHPYQEFNTLDALLKPGGWIGMARPKTIGFSSSGEFWFLHGWSLGFPACIRGIK
jgi:hypothetical protein